MADLDVQAVFHRHLQHWGLRKAVPLLDQKRWHARRKEVSKGSRTVLKSPLPQAGCGVYATTGEVCRRDRDTQRFIGSLLVEVMPRQGAHPVGRSEYKRRQAPPGVKITPKAFGRDRRLPITNQFAG